VLDNFFQIVPRTGAQILLVLFLSFLIGLEREEHKVADDRSGGFGGVRTYPLIGLLGYSLMLVSGGALSLACTGLAVVGLMLWQSYRHKLETNPAAGMTSEVSALVTFAIGALVYREEYWIATTLTVIGVALLELKSWLESLVERVPGEEILTFAKFLLLTAVILPVVPNQTIGNFGFNPRKTWFVVVAVSAISYGSYLIQKTLQGKGGVTLAALLGGCYSSTATTVVLAKHSRDANRPHLYAGATLLSSGMMYLRLLLLIAIFSHALLLQLRWPFLALAAAGMLGGLLFSRLPDRNEKQSDQPYTPKNPLEISAALIFGGLFVLLLWLTHFAVHRAGNGGLYLVGVAMGVVDVDPFVLGLTQSAGAQTAVALAAGAILVTAASNNVVKGIYAYSFGNHRTGLQSAILLFALAAAGLIPLIWLAP
jgi:uncharacterized membrane protein (DUF4010 family)